MRAPSVVVLGVVIVRPVMHQVTTSAAHHLYTGLRALRRLSIGPAGVVNRIVKS
ncbi:MAG: hypothetical protein SNJ52_03190 [Verrucomicrobiia bacterium]